MVNFPFCLNQQTLKISFQSSMTPLKAVGEQRKVLSIRVTRVQELVRRVPSAYDSVDSQGTKMMLTGSEQEKQQKEFLMNRSLVMSIFGKN